jgi:hypothetical protein
MSGIDLQRSLKAEGTITGRPIQGDRHLANGVDEPKSLASPTEKLLSAASLIAPRP